MENNATELDQRVNDVLNEPECEHVGSKDNAKEMTSELILTENDPIVARQYKGNVENFERGFLSGWVHDISNKGERIEFEVYSKNILVASGLADEYRRDLRDNGIGDGAHGFYVKLDESVLDGNSHQVIVVVKDSGIIVGKYEFAADVVASSVIENITAGNINGTIKLKQETDATGFEIEVLCDGKVCTTGTCAKSDNSNHFKYSVKLPTAVFDDCYHVYSVRLKSLVTKSNSFQERISSITTPWEHLSNDIRAGTLSALPKTASYRYKALQSQLRLIGENDLSSSAAANLLLAHDVIVEGYENRRKFEKLFLPEVINPVVSIVIPVHNKFALTYNCIASLILASNKASYEVIVVDDTSTDETTELDQYIGNAKLVINEKNKGFLRSCNAGADAARGEYLIFLNNDTEVTDLWIDELLSVFTKFDSVGIVGSKLIYPNGDLQEAGGVIWGNGKPWNYGNGANAEDPKYNYVRQADYVSGAALMISRPAWDKVEGFSDSYAPAYYEDVDLAFKVREAGLKTYYCPSSVVVHFEGMSNGRDLDNGIKQFQSINAPRFRKTWRHSYKNNGKEAINVDFQKDRNVDFRVLFVDYTTPRPDHDAGGYAAAQEIQLLQELGCKVTFMPNNLAHFGKYTRALQNDGVECLYAPFYSSVGECIAERGMEFDLIYIIRYDIAEQLLPYIKQYSNAKVVLNNCDLHFLREIRAALVSDDKNMDGPIDTRRRELNVIKEVDALLSYNEIEHSIIASHNLSVNNIFKCPWVLNPQRSESTPTFSERSGIAFLGSFNHTPNAEAVKYFVNSVMPELRKEMPGIELKIYGSRMTKDIEELACDDVLIMGYAETLSAVYDSCRIFIAPLLSGAGIKGKVLESMSYGVPSVLSPVAAEATGLAHGTSALIANNEQEWTDHIKRLYVDEELWNSIAEASHELVTNNYSRSNALSELSKLMEYLELDPANSRPKMFKYG